MPQQNHSNTGKQRQELVSVGKSTIREDSAVARLGTEIPAVLMKRTKLVIALSEERLTIRQLIAEGLELRVSQLEKEIESKAGVA